MNDFDAVFKTVDFAHFILFQMNYNQRYGACTHSMLTFIMRA